MSVFISQFILQPLTQEPPDPLAQPGLAVCPHYVSHSLLIPVVTPHLCHRLSAWLHVLCGCGWCPWRPQSQHGTGMQ